MGEGLETPRRMRAVETLLASGWKWDGTQWLPDASVSKSSKDHMDGMSPAERGAFAGTVCRLASEIGVSYSAKEKCQLGAPFYAFTLMELVNFAHTIAVTPNISQPFWNERPEARDGYYLASFKRSHDRGYVIWWMPDNAGYTTDLAQAGVYLELVEGYHDSEETVPVPVALIERLRVRRMVDVGDSANRGLWTAKELRALIAGVAGENSKG